MTARKSLEELLDLIFGAEDLRRFVEQGLGRHDAEAVRHDIKWDGSPSSNRIPRVVDALELQGAVDADFFEQLLATFPERSPEIEQVARQWLPDRPPGDTVSRQPTLTSEPPAVPEGGAWDVFLAHAGPDGARADTLYNILAEQGLNVFLDSR